MVINNSRCLLESVAPRERRCKNKKTRSCFQERVNEKRLAYFLRRTIIRARSADTSQREHRRFRNWSNSETLNTIHSRSTEIQNAARSLQGSVCNEGNSKRSRYAVESRILADEKLVPLNASTLNRTAPEVYPGIVAVGPTNTPAPSPVGVPPSAEPAKNAVLTSSGERVMKFHRSVRTTGQLSSLERHQQIVPFWRRNQHHRRQPKMLEWCRQPACSSP